MNGQKYTVEFETVVRGVILYIEAWALADYEGIYKTGFDAYIDGADVTGLLTDDDIATIDAQIESAMYNEHIG
jgi:hypothetical protein